LELTESLLMEDTDANKAVLAAFQKLGVKLAIDDFGTGHSSLSYLRRLDVDTLKIDRSFVMQIPNESEDCAIATAVVALGKSLQMKVVAEGVETEAQAQFLRELGCNDMQGWLLSRALPPDELAPWLRDKHRDYLMRTQPKRFNSVDVEDFPDIRIPEVPRAASAAALVVQTLRAEATAPGA
jgi:EAL domain-containing protein (putative c-di-GMP-specific phosphodiesterase class I)